jgi:hypothetical protein
VFVVWLVGGRVFPGFFLLQSMRLNNNRLTIAKK